MNMKRFWGAIALGLFGLFFMIWAIISMRGHMWNHPYNYDLIYFTTVGDWIKFGIGFLCYIVGYWGIKKS